jgi:hypothetical protein
VGVPSPYPLAVRAEAFSSGDGPYPPFGPSHLVFGETCGGGGLEDFDRRLDLIIKRESTTGTFLAAEKN